MRSLRTLPTIFNCFKYSTYVVVKPDGVSWSAYESYDEYCPMEDLEYLEFKVAVLDGDSYYEICISDPVTISFE